VTSSTGRGGRRYLPYAFTEHGALMAIPKPFLAAGVFQLQQVQPVSLPRLERKPGALSIDEFKRVGAALVGLLHLQG